MNQQRWNDIKWEKDNEPEKFKQHEAEYIEEGFKDPPEEKKEEKKKKK